MKNRKVISLEDLEKKVLEQEQKTIVAEVKRKHKIIDDFFKVSIFKKPID